MKAKKTPNTVRRFELLGAAYILFGLAWFSYGSMTNKAYDAIAKIEGRYFLDACALAEALFNGWLIYWITRKRSPTGKWIYVSLFFLLSIPWVLSRRALASDHDAAYCGAFGMCALHGYLVYLLFTPEFRKWLKTDAKPSPRAPRNEKKLGIRAMLWALAGVVGLLCYGWHRYKAVFEILTHLPPKVEDKVLLGDGYFKKAVFYQDPLMGAVSGIATGRLDPDPRVQVAAAGGRDAVYLDRQGYLVKSVTLAPDWRSSLGQVRFIDRPDHASLLLNPGGWTSAPALYAHDGTKLWTQGKSANWTAAGDFKGDGHLKYLVCDKGDIRLLNEEGEQIWAQNEGWVWHAEIAAFSAGQRPLIVLNSRGSDLVVLNENGDELFRTNTPAHLFQFSLLPWPDASSYPAILSVNQNGLYVLGLHGAVKAHWSAPLCKDGVDSQAVWFQATPASPPCLAVSVEVPRGSVFLVYDTQGNILYEETRSCMSDALAVLSGPAGQSLLLGGDGEITELTPGGR